MNRFFINLNDYLLLVVLLALRCSDALPSSIRQQRTIGQATHQASSSAQQHHTTANIIQRQTQIHSENVKPLQQPVNHPAGRSASPNDGRIIFPKDENSIILANVRSSGQSISKSKNSNTLPMVTGTNGTRSSSALSSKGDVALEAKASVTPILSSLDAQTIVMPELGTNGKPSCLSDSSSFFCEDVANYPKLDSNDILYQSGELRLLFQFNFNEEIDSRKSLETTFNEDEQPLCRYNQKIVFPKVAQNKEQKWLYIVNDDNEFRQSITSEVCADKSECLNIQQSLPFGSETSCKQKFAFRRLMAIHPTDKTMYADVFKFPSCCSCYLKSALGRSSP